LNAKQGSIKSNKGDDVEEELVLKRKWKKASQ